MLLGFIIWSVTCVALAGFGVYSLCAKKPVCFWANGTAPKVSDVKKYNRAVAILWFAYALIFELLGVPLLFLKQNSAGFVIPVLGSMAATIALVVGYLQIEKKFRV